MSESFIANCGHEIAKLPEGVSAAAGYATLHTGAKVCYGCAAKLELQSMHDTGKATLYLCDVTGGKLDACASRDRMRLTDWPGVLSFLVSDYKYSKGYGLNGSSYTIITGHFIGPDAHVWTFRNAGDMQLARCKRTKQTAPRNPEGRSHA